MGHDHHCTQAGVLAMTHKFNNQLYLYTTSACTITRKNDISGKRVAILNSQKNGLYFSLPLSCIAAASSGQMKLSPSLLLSKSKSHPALCHREVEVLLHRRLRLQRLHGRV